MLWLVFTMLVICDGLFWGRVASCLMGLRFVCLSLVCCVAFAVRVVFVWLFVSCLGLVWFCGLIAWFGFDINSVVSFWILLGVILVCLSLFALFGY